MRGTAAAARATRRAAPVQSLLVGGHDRIEVVSSAPSLLVLADDDEQAQDASDERHDAEAAALA